MLACSDVLYTNFCFPVDELMEIRDLLSSILYRFSFEAIWLFFLNFSGGGGEHGVGEDAEDGVTYEGIASC